MRLKTRRDKSLNVGVGWEVTERLAEKGCVDSDWESEMSEEEVVCEVVNIEAEVVGGVHGGGVEVVSEVELLCFLLQYYLCILDLIEAFPT